MDELIAFAESRQERRARTLLKGRIVFDDQTRTVDCIVRNISSVGARLEVEATGLPAHFVLEIPQRDLRVRAQLIWCRSPRVGVIFTCRAGATAGVEAARAENRRLRRSIQALEQRLRDIGQEVDAS